MLLGDFVRMKMDVLRLLGIKSAESFTHALTQIGHILRS
jgi:hypothetical protein